MGAKLFFRGMNNVKDPRTLDVLVTRDSTGGEMMAQFERDISRIVQDKAAMNPQAWACRSERF